jgi:hypothetical protein
MKCIFAEKYKTTEMFSPPPLGPVSVSPVDGSMTITVCGGNFVQSLTVTPRYDTQAALRGGQNICWSTVPVYLGIATGFRFGVYRRPYSSPMFTMFRLTPTGSDFLPLSYGLVCRSREKGTIFYLTGLDEALKVGALHVDEGEGSSRYKHIFCCSVCL